MQSLEGSRNDVISLRDVLISRLGFSSADIEVLLDSDATHAGIKEALARLVERTKQDDFVFLYFAGHGTSAENSYLRIPLAHTTGAVLPSDFEIGDSKAMLEKLIVGRRDLRPVLSTLDSGGRHVLVAIDACFSGQTVRGRHLNETGRPQLPVREVSIDLGRVDSKAETSTEDDGKYPYAHVAYISAAAINEGASEIKSEYLKYYPTIDGKPHGAFTDALLRALHGNLPATSGTLRTFQLHAAIRAFMQQRGYPQTPQLLPLPEPNSAWEPNAPLTEGMAAADQSVTDETAPSHHSRMAVRLTGARSQELRKGLEHLQQITLVSKDEELTVWADNGQARLLSPSGDLVFSAGLDQPEHILQAVSQQAWIRSLFQHSGGAPNDLALEFDDDQLGATRLAGARVGFRLFTNSPGYLALIAIDPAGTIRVMYPAFQSELAKIDSHQSIRVGGIDVVPPYGVEEVVGLEFKQPPDWLLPFASEDLPVTGAAWHEFAERVKARSQDSPVTLLQTITASR